MFDVGLCYTFAQWQLDRHVQASPGNRFRLPNVSRYFRPLDAEVVDIVLAEYASLVRMLASFESKITLFAAKQIVYVFLLNSNDTERFRNVLAPHVKASAWISIISS